MEVAATMEFGLRGDVTENSLWQWATKVISDAEQVLTNSRGEFDLG